MATTTNYGWATPDDTDLVKDGAAAIRTLGSSVDTTTKALNPSTTLGDIEYRSATANTNTRLAIGSTGDVLTVTGGVPVWAELPAAGGKVLQVVHASTSTIGESATSAFADTGLTATITPSADTSKILVLVNQAGVSKDTGNTAAALQLLRGATVLTKFAGLGGQTDNSSTNTFNAATTSWLDSPATTSATTYKTQFASQANVSRVLVQVTTSVSTITLLEIGA